MRRVVADYKDVFGMWRKSLKVDGNQSFTRSGQVWQSMSYRCKANGAEQLARSTYVGCSVSENFKDFQYFANWHVKAIGYGVAGYHLDKDILIKGNKVYHEGRCVLVPQALNSFLTNRKAKRGKYVIGVTLLRGHRFVAQLHRDGITNHLGVFTTESKAYSAYKSAKEDEGYRWYERLKAGEFIVDERVIERMRTWTLEE